MMLVVLHLFQNYLSHIETKGDNECSVQVSSVQSWAEFRLMRDWNLKLRDPKSEELSTQPPGCGVEYNTV